MEEDSTGRQAGHRQNDENDASNSNGDERLSNGRSRKVWISNEGPMDGLTYEGKEAIGSVDILCFVGVRFTAALVQSINRFRYFRKGKILHHISLFCCRGLVSEALRALSGLTCELRFDGTILNETACQVLGQVFEGRGIQGMHRVSFQGTRMSSELAYALSYGLQNTNKLREFVWNNNGHDLETESSPAELIDMILNQGIAKNRSLRRIEFWQEHHHVIRLLHAIRLHPALEHLAVPTRSIARIIGALHQLAKSNRRLKSFKFFFLDRVDTETLRTNPLPKFRSACSSPNDTSKSIEYSFEITGAFDEDMSDLGAALLCNPVRFVDLSHTQISDCGIATLAPCLRHVRELRLQGTNIQERGVQALLRTMNGEGDHVNCNLESLRLPLISPNDPSSRTMVDIQHFLDLNRAGRRLLLIDDVPLGLWTLVVARVAVMNSFPSMITSEGWNEKEQKERRANALFHLLQGPALFHVTASQ